VAANVALEVKDDQNKSNDLITLVTTESERRRHSNPRPVLLMNSKEAKMTRIMNTVKTLFKSLTLFCLQGCTCCKMVPSILA
jgi:hypothetical protein